MKKKRYTEEQIAFALRQAEAGVPVKEVSRKMGIRNRLSVAPLVSGRQCDRPFLESRYAAIWWIGFYPDYT